MRAKELRDRGDEELIRMLEDNKSQLFRFRLQNATHQLDNTSRIRTVRREIARITTVLKERASQAGAQTDSAQDGEE